jgi:hypothetical protein
VGTHLKIAVGMVVSNSNDTLVSIIQNFINQGIFDFYIIDHLSDPPVSHTDFENLSQEVNIRLLQKRTTPFYQGTLMSYLVYLAQLEEFDVFIPCDSDEFHLPLNYTENLRQLITSYFWDTTEFGFLVKVENYVQSSDAINFSPQNALKIKYRIKNPPIKSNGDVSYLNYSVLHRESDYKIIFKLEKNLRYIVTEGSHGLQVEGKSINLSLNPLIVIGHIPYRSRASLVNKVRLGERRRIANFPGDVGWQNQLLIGASEKNLDDIWLRSSYVLNHEGVACLNGDSNCLEFDLLLTNLFNELIESASKRNNNFDQSKLTRTTPDYLSLSFDFTGRFIAERDSISSSTIWIGLRLYRWLRRKF